MPCRAYLYGGVTKNKGGVGLLQISQKERFFLLLWQPCDLEGNLTTWLPFLDPPRKAFLSPSVCSRSIVCVGASTSPPQKPPPLFSWQAPFKSANCPSPPLYTIPRLYWFFVKFPLWKSDFSMNDKILKFFIPNAILTFKSNYILS